MIKRIIQIADVHIPNLANEDLYAKGLNELVKKCNQLTEGFEKEECRIIICGDLVHQKNTISNELLLRVNNFMRPLEEVCKVIVISGNHDFVESNTSRVGTLEALFAMMQLKNTIFLDCYFHQNYTEQNMLEGDVTPPYSGFYTDDNVTYCLYSIMGEGKYKYENPFSSQRIKTPSEIDKTLKIGLYHGQVQGCVGYNGAMQDVKVCGDLFKNCDIVMAGDIHKRQKLQFGDTLFVYSGSPIQQNFGETILEHGICVWDIDDNEISAEPTFIDIELGNFGYYNFVVNSIDDLTENKEKITNYD